MKWLGTEVAVAEDVTEEVAEDVAAVAAEVTAVRTQHRWAAVVVGRGVSHSRIASTLQHATFAVAPGSSVFTSRCSGREGLAVEFPAGAGLTGMLDLWACSIFRIPTLYPNPCGLNDQHFRSTTNEVASS